MLHQQVVPQESLELLKQVSPILARDGFYLAGGTALALRLGHRVSIDFDFFCPGSFIPGDEADKLGQAVDASPHILQLTAGSASMMLRGTKIELLEYRYPMLGAIEVLDGISLCSIEDNAAMKLSAVASRGLKKDLVDVAALLQVAALDQLLEWFVAKYPNVETFMVLKSLTWFEDAEREPDPVFLHGQSWREAKETIIAAVR